MIYTELTCNISDDFSTISEILIAQLSDIGFESFVEDKDILKAYIPSLEFNFEKVQSLQVVKIHNEIVQFSYIEIEQKNWNSEWESNYPPVIVSDKVLIKAPFHNIIQSYDYEVLIEPKMSFGTGHHSTTSLMIEKMLKIDFTKKSVLDIGCGTAVLAILAKMKNAKNVLAIDIEEWAYENSIENCKKNNFSEIEVLKGDSKLISDKKFDIILANINKNILLQDIPIYSKCLNSNGLLLVSGIFTFDIQDIILKAKNNELIKIDHQEKNEWACISFEKA